MKIKISLFLVLFPWFGFAQQQLQILSAKDSLRIPFVSLLIKNDQVNITQSGNADGVLNLSHKLNDSTVYAITIYCFGFEKYCRKFSGADIRSIKAIYLVPANINLNEVVITAQYEPTIAERSVQKIKVIDGEKIRAMGAVNLKDVLSNQLNVRLQQDNILGSGMSLQGISGENVKYLLMVFLLSEGLTATSISRR